MIDKKAIGKRIRYFRQEKELKQKELANRVGVSRSILSRTETGHLLPTVPFLLRFRENFNLSIDWILTGKEPTVSTWDGEEGELTIVFEEMKKDKALKYLVLSTFYFFKKLIIQDEER